MCNDTRNAPYPYDPHEPDHVAVSQPHQADYTHDRPFHTPHTGPRATFRIHHVPRKALSSFRALLRQQIDRVIVSPFRRKRRSRLNVRFPLARRGASLKGLDHAQPKPRTRGANSVTTWKPHGPLARDEKLYFLHIPKTAGTSLRTYLESHFHVDEVCPHLTIPEILPHPPSSLRRYRLFCGHHGMHLPRLIRDDPIIVTILREPIERCISHFRHIQSEKQDWLHEQVRSMTFEEFVMSDHGVIELLNFQTRFLVEDNLRRDYFGHSDLRVSDLVALEAKYSDPARLDRACDLLDRAAFVGIQERFDDALRLLAHTFGWSPVTTFPKYNAARVKFDPSSLTPAVLERLNELTRLDRALYDHARRIFESRFAAITPEAIENAYREVMLAHPRLDRVFYGFEQPISGDNWLPRERSDGQWRRWSGPGTVTTLDLPLATERPLVLRFLVGAQTFDVIESMRLFVNGVEQHPEWWPMHDPPQAQRTCEVILEPDLLRLNPAYTRLTFQVNRVVVPAREWRGHEDTCSYALHFFWLEVSPQ